MSVYVGIDVHRKRSQVAVIDQGGEVLANRNVPNGVAPILSVIPPTARLSTPAAFEAAFGWGWLLELLEDFASSRTWSTRCSARRSASARLKNNKVDAATLAQLLRADLLPERGSSPPGSAAAAALLRRRGAAGAAADAVAGPVCRAVLADHGHGRPEGCWSGPGRQRLASLGCPPSPRGHRRRPGADGRHRQPVDRLERRSQRARSDPRVRVAHPAAGVGPFTALVLLAEIGDITRFGSARKLASWAGLTPTVRGSDRTVRHGHISKQGPAWVRWVLCEAAQTAKRHPDSPPATRPSPAAAARRSPPRRSPASSSPAPITCSPTPAAAVRPASGGGRKPRASSQYRMSRPCRAR